MLLFNTKDTGAGKSLDRPTSRCILFDDENISFDASLVLYIYINITNVPPIMIKNRVVRIFRLMLVLLYIYINITNVPPIMIKNRMVRIFLLMLVLLYIYKHY
jgi:hypothetical protein